MPDIAEQNKRAQRAAVPKKKPDAHSIRTRIVVPIGFVIALQFLLLAGGIWGSGLMQQLDASTRKALQQTVSTRMDYLQNDMVNRWCDVDSTVQALNGIFQQMQDDGFTAGQMYRQSDGYEPFLTQATPELISLMRKNAVTGAYMILYSGELPPDSNREMTLPGVYLRDRDPASSYTAGNHDIMLERAPIRVASAMGLSTDTGWTPMFHMCAAHENEASFFKPYRAAQQAPGQAYFNLSYWSRPYQIEGDNYQAISYSVPLIAKDGTLYGVLGVEVLTDYILRQLPTGEVAGGEGAYVLCIRDAHGGLSPILVSSANARYDLTAFSGMTAHWDERAECYRLSAKGISDFCACADTFKLYNSNTPYSGDQWILFAAAPQATMRHLSAQVTRTMSGILLAVLIATLGVLGWISLQLSRPIARLEREVRLGTGGSAPVVLTRSGITELDSLAQGVETLHREVLRNAGKLSRILEMSSTRLSAFEFDTVKHSVFASEGFFRVFGRDDIRCYGLTGAAFAALLKGYDRYILPGTVRSEKNYQECVYEIFTEQGILWVKLKTIRRGTTLTGLAEDITGEWQEMRKLEFERDHDALTGIYNRRAFYEKMQVLFTDGTNLGWAALIMMDLDNLKYTNDTYGHDYGDQYIRTAAQSLACVGKEKALAARMSGDEFFLFVYGHPTRQSAEQVITELKVQMHTRRLQLPDGTDTFVRASAGVAWYPVDAKDPEHLVRYADFAMYKGKHSTKGTFVNFDYETYCREAYLLQGKESLNRLVEQHQVQYDFQPIVEAASGTVIAYEALMRPQIPSLDTPAAVLTLARQESKLGEIERMTWFSAMQAFTDFCRSGELDESCSIFINSISNQMLSEEDTADFEKVFRPWLGRIVQEHTEEEQSNPLLLRKKLERLHRWHAQIALDDYGSGYNGENVLVTIDPDYVKVDMGIVHGVDTDPNKQQVIAGLIAYTQPRGIRVIAEGVETEAEMQEVLRLGVGYLQGFYLARPAKIPPLADPIHLEKVREAARKNQ